MPKKAGFSVNCLSPGRYREVSKTRHFASLAIVYTLPMAEPIRILTVEREDEDGLIVTFSDGTTTGYVTEELLELRPFREPSESRRSDSLRSAAGLPENVTRSRPLRRAGPGATALD